MTLHTYLWDSVDDVCISSVEDGQALTTYTVAPSQFGQIVSSNDGTATSQFHYDAISSARNISNQAGNITATAVFDAWGSTVSSAGDFGMVRFGGEVGYQWIGDNSYWVRERVYSPSIARWTSADPIGFEGGLPIHGYVANNPVTRLDPSGMDFGIGSGVVIVGGIALLISGCGGDECKNKCKRTKLAGGPWGKPWTTVEPQYFHGEWTEYKRNTTCNNVRARTRLVDTYIRNNTQKLDHLGNEYECTRTATWDKTTGCTRTDRWWKLAETNNLKVEGSIKSTQEESCGWFWQKTCCSVTYKVAGWIKADFVEWATYKIVCPPECAKSEKTCVAQIGPWCKNM